MTELPVGKERIYLFAPAAVIVMRVTLAGSVTADALCDAIQRVAAREAVLCSRVEQRGNGSAAFVPCAPALPQIGGLLPGETPEAALRREAGTPFAVEQGEWMRHTLVRAGEESVWLLACHHMAGDGISLLYFIRDVGEALQNPLHTWELRPAMRCPAAQGSLSVPMRWGLNALNRQWEKTGHSFGPADRARLMGAYWGGRCLGMAQAAVEAPQLERVLAACRAHGVTLTAAWLAAVMAHDPGAMDAGIAVSIRPEGYEGMANLATGVSVRCTQGGKPFWATAQTLHRLLRKQRTDERKRNFLRLFLQALSPTLIDAACFSAFDGLDNPAARRIAAMFGYTGHKKSCSVTNLLRAPLESGDVRRVVFYPPMVPNARRMFGLVTVRGTLEITLQCFAPTEGTRALLDAVLSRLLQACAA